MVSDLTLMGKKAIQTEAKALALLAEGLDETFEKACQLIFRCQGTVILTGMGKSGLVARKWASTFASTGTKSYFINPAEAQHGDLGMIHPSDLLIALSYSGETEELTFILRHALQLELPILGITGNRKSALASQSSHIILIPPAQEACPLNLAPTTSSTLMIALGDAFAVTLMQMRNFTEAQFAKLHPGGSLGRRVFLSVKELMHTQEALPLVSPEASLEHVLIEMTRKRLGLAIVAEDRRILGIITDGDIRRLLQKRGMDARVLAKDFMTKDPKTVPPDTLAYDAAEILAELRIHHLVICESEKIVGVIHLDDLVREKIV